MRIAAQVSLEEGSVCRSTVSLCAPKDEVCHKSLVSSQAQSKMHLHVQNAVLCVELFVQPSPA